MPNIELREVPGDSRRRYKIPGTGGFSSRAPIIEAWGSDGDFEGLKYVSERGKGRCGGGSEVFRSDKASRRSRP